MGNNREQFNKLNYKELQDIKGGYIIGKTLRP